MTISLFRTGLPLLVSLLLSGCGNPNQRLDEYVFYEGPHIQLKVVRYYRNIPFNYLGEQAVVMCRSENTAHIQADDPQDAGWRILGAGSGHESKTARQAAAAVSPDYEIRGKDILISKQTVLNVSFDACGHFINWDPGRLPEAMIDRVEKPDSCAPDGPADCRYLDFEGDRAPRYEQIRVTGTDKVSFTVRSSAFRGIESLRVRSGNNSAIWHVQTTSLNIEDRRLDASTLPSIPVVRLDTGSDDARLADWLESSLPPGSILIWPDTLTECRDQSEAVKTSAAAACAAIRFNDSEGNSGMLYIEINPDAENSPGKPAFHSAFYKAGDQRLWLSSLTALRKTLSRPAN